MVDPDLPRFMGGSWGESGGRASESPRQRDQSPPCAHRLGPPIAHGSTDSTAHGFYGVQDRRNAERVRLTWVVRYAIDGTHRSKSYRTVRGHHDLPSGGHRAIFFNADLQRRSSTLAKARQKLALPDCERSASGDGRDFGWPPGATCLRRFLQGTRHRTRGRRRASKIFGEDT